jgi:hypothetical protein
MSENLTLPSARLRNLLIYQFGSNLASVALSCRAIRSALAPAFSEGDGTQSAMWSAWPSPQRGGRAVFSRCRRESPP